MRLVRFIGGLLGVIVLLCCIASWFTGCCVCEVRVCADSTQATTQASTVR